MLQLTPPEGAAPGERVRFGDLEAAQRDADTPNRCASPLRPASHVVRRASYARAA